MLVGDVLRLLRKTLVLAGDRSDGGLHFWRGFLYILPPFRFLSGSERNVLLLCSNTCVSLRDFFLDVLGPLSFSTCLSTFLS